MNERRNFDVIIIGAGPAGLTAGLYTARARLNSLIIEKGIVGGQVVNAERIENYPGFPDDISGLELGQLMHQQTTKFGAQTLNIEVTGIELQERRKVVKTPEGNFAAKTIIIACGSEREKLSVPGEAKFTGKGVSYCAICDAAFFRDQPVAVVGGGDTAITEALHLAKFATKVTVIHRRHELRTTRILQERAFAEPKITFLWDTIIEEIEGEDIVKRLRLRNVLTKEKSTLEIAGIFVSVGLKPSTAYLKEMLPLDPAGYIVTNEKMETAIPGIFAAGDIRANSVRQIVAAAGDGATAAIYAERFIAEGK